MDRSQKESAGEAMARLCVHTKQSLSLLFVRFFNGSILVAYLFKDLRVCICVFIYLCVSVRFGLVCMCICLYVQARTVRRRVNEQLSAAAYVHWVTIARRAQCWPIKTPAPLAHTAARRD